MSRIFTGHFMFHKIKQEKFIDMYDITPRKSLCIQLQLGKGSNRKSKENTCKLFKNVLNTLNTNYTHYK